MKTKFLSSTFKRSILILFVLLTGVSYAGNDDGYDIKIILRKVKEGTSGQLCYYYGEKQYIKDSVKANAKGEFIFKGEEKLDQGVYLFVYPKDTTYFDFLVDETQHFTLETDTGKVNYIKNMKIKGSAENQLFFTYQQFMIKKQNEAIPLREQYGKISKDNKDSLKLIEDKLKKMGEEVKAYQKNLIESNPSTFVAKFLKALEEPVIPEAPILEDGKKDSTFAYKYYKAHYFDNIDLSDDRMLRTPFLHSTVKRYIDKLTPPLPDSIAESCDRIIELAKPNPEMFKYFVWYFTYTYETSKYMGMDAVFVHLGKKYYKTGQVTWLDSAQLDKIIKAVDRLDNVIIGRQAPFLNMKDSSGKYISLYDLKSDYTIVVFWDHDCGHCRKAIPKLDSIYTATLKDMGVEVYAVETEDKPEEWKKFIQKHNLTWYNVHETDAARLSNAKYYYNVTSTPLIYLLDKKKVIRAKKLDPEKIADVVKMLKEEEERENKKAEK